MTCVALATAAGTKFYIGAALPATYDIAGYAAVSWTEVGDISSLGEFGKTYNPATFKILGSRSTCKRKGTYDYGSIAITMGYTAEAAGQIALNAALGNDNDLPYKIVLNDATAILLVPTVFYFPGQMMSWKINPGSDPDAFVTATTEIQIDGDVVIDVRSAT